MPLPLLWLGAAVSAAYAGNEIAKSLSCDEGNIALFPGERSTASVEPVNGAVVCCGIYDVLIHTGVWWEGMVIELAGTGLIRAVSAERFLANRSGDNIYTACKPSSMVMAEEAWALRGIDRLYTYSEYNVVQNNCHQFVAQCITACAPPVTRFGQLNKLLSQSCECMVSWHPVKI